MRPQQQVLQDVRKLISLSTQRKEDPKMSDFHKAIVGQYFNAQNVEIDYTNKRISFELSLEGEGSEKISFEYLDLHAFLSVCLKEDASHLNFYKNMLSRYKSN